MSLNSSVDTISGGSVTAQKYGIVVRTISAGNTKVGTIDGVTISTTASGGSLSSVYSAIAVYGEHSGGVARVDRIANCKIDCNGSHNYGGAIHVVNGNTGVPTSVGTIEGCTITANNGASGISLARGRIDQLINNTVKVTTGCGIVMSAPNWTKGIDNYIGLISGGTYRTTTATTDSQAGNGILAFCVGEGPCIGEIKGATIEGTHSALLNKNVIGNISDSSFTQTGDANNTAGIINDSMSKSKIGDMTNVTITADGMGIHNKYRTTIGDMTNVIIDACKKAGTGWRAALYSDTATIGDVKGGKIAANASSGNLYGIYQSGGTINSISGACEIKSNANTGIYVISGGRIPGGISGSSIQGTTYGIRVSTSTSSTSYSGIGPIKDSEIGASGASAYGIAMQGGVIDSIYNTKIKPVSTGSAYGTYQQGTINRIEKSEIRTTAGGSGYAIFMDGSNQSTSEYYAAKTTIIDETIITAETMALIAQKTAHIGTLSRNRFFAKNSYCVLISGGGVIDEITSGTYAGKIDAVYASGGNAPGKLGAISGNPVFYGETGYAVHNDGPKTDIEMALSTEPRGNARYYGGEGQISRTPDQDNYPTYTPNNELYFMSVNSTDGQVADETLEALAGLSLSGVPFHFLTVNHRLAYDGNGSTGGNMTDKGVTDEHGTTHKLAKNGFTRTHHEFVEWNTQADGAGESYAEDADFTLINPSTTLYAIWRRIPPEKIKAEVTARKTLSGDKATADIQDEQFTFTVKRSDGTSETESTVKVKAGGEIDLGETLAFDAPGNYTLTFKEDNLAAPGYTYDDAEYTYRANVVLNEETNKLALADGSGLFKGGGGADVARHKNEDYARRVGVAEFAVGMALLIAGLVLILFP